MFTKKPETHTDQDTSTATSESSTETVDINSTEGEKKQEEHSAHEHRAQAPSAAPKMPFGMMPQMGAFNQTQNTLAGQGNKAGLGHNSAQEQDFDADRKLVIGEGISISGDINSCEYLVVEGDVKSDFKGSDRLDVTQSGTFKGSAITNDADIAGVFDGTLTVNGRLTVRETGKIKGTIVYQELAVEAGAAIEGKLSIVGSSSAPSQSKSSSSKKSKSNAKKTSESPKGDDNVTQMQFAGS